MIMLYTLLDQVNTAICSFQAVSDLARDRQEKINVIRTRSGFCVQDLPPLAILPYSRKFARAINSP